MYSRRRASLAMLSTLILSPAAFAAPKPTRPVEVDPRITAALAEQVEAKERQMRFQAAGLTIPAVPSLGGLCLIDTAGHYAPTTGQVGPSGTYRLYEIQRWVVSPLPIQPGQIPLTYSVSWDSVGNGLRHEDDGVGTVNDWLFGIRAANNTALTARKNAVGSWLVQIAPTSMPNGVSVTQQQTISGRANPPGTVLSPDFSVVLPGMTFAPQPGSQTNTQVAGTQSFSWLVPQQVGWGYPKPGYATGKISCTWNVSVGP